MRDDGFEHWYELESERNVKAGLAPAFESLPRLIDPVNCYSVPERNGLFLLPGHIGLSEYEVTLGIAQELSASIQTLKNLPGAPSYLLDKTAEAYNADYVLIDMNPSLSSLNQNLLMTSHYFIVPTTPDYFSVMAIKLPSQHSTQMARMVPQRRNPSHSPGRRIPVPWPQSKVPRDNSPELPPTGRLASERFPNLDR